MIYLNPEVASGLGEDTFWTWFKREFPGARFGLPDRLNEDDIVLQYSTLGFADRTGKSVALLWELYPEMKARLRSNEWDDKIAKIDECAKFSTYRTVSTSLMTPYYERFGTIHELPIGVDTNLFKPLDDKPHLRKKYQIPIDATVGFWCGTTHVMKGFERLKQYAARDPTVHWIIVWKDESERGFLPGASQFVKAPQSTLCELMNASDFYLSCSLLRPFYMVEWEAMACDLPIRLIDENLPKDFVLSSHPREDVFRLGWDRGSAKKTWQRYLEARGVSW
jgi:glycosyltransferase involved in cell wall biosynthesis